MRIFTDNLHGYEKLTPKLTVTGNRDKEAVYLNFEDSYLYLRADDSSSRIQFKYEGNKVDNFFVSASKFFYLCSMYDYLDVEDKVFFNGKDKFELNTPGDTEFVLVETYLDIFKKDENEQLLGEFTIGDDIFDAFKDIVNYTEHDSGSPLNGIFIKDNKMIATNNVRFYEKKVDSKHNELNLSISNVRVLSNLSSKSDVVIRSFPNSINVESGDIEIYFNLSTQLHCPVISDKFIATYTHPTYFCIEISKLDELLRFLEPFTKDLPSQRLICSITDTNTMELKIIDFNQVSKSIAISECSRDLVGKEFMVSSNHLRTMCSNIDDEYLMIRVSGDKGKSAMDFIGVKNKDTHIVMTKLLEN